MSTEVRRVPADWEHPKNQHGEFIPIYDETYEHVCEEWYAGCVAWVNNTHPEKKRLQAKYPDLFMYYHDWQGGPPENDTHYRQPFSSVPDHYQMYETVSEGTPISPVLPTPEALARWLADNNASAFGRDTATYEQWLNVITEGGFAPTAVFDSSGLKSGVAALSKE